MPVKNFRRINKENKNSTFLGCCFCFGWDIGIRILASRRRSVRLGSNSLAAARSHSGSDSHPRLSFIALVPLRYATGASFTTEPVRIHYLKKQSGFEFSRLDDARSGSALTVSLRLGHTRVLTAIQGCHSLPSCRFATPQAPHSLPSPFESIISKNNRDSNSRVSTTLGQARL